MKKTLRILLPILSGMAMGAFLAGLVRILQGHPHKSIEPLLFVVAANALVQIHVAVEDIRAKLGEDDARPRDVDSNHGEGDRLP